MDNPVEFDRSAVVPLLRRESRRLHGQFIRDLHRRAARQIEPLSEPLDGKAAADYLGAQAARLDDDLSSQVQAFPSHWWLLLLRYISPTIFACHSGNYSKYRGYAERVSARSTRHLDGVAANAILGEPQIKRAIRLAVTAAVREDLHIASGHVSAGARLAPDPDQPYRVVMDERTTQVMRRFDTQLRLMDQDVLTRMGATYLNPVDPGAINLERTLVALSALELPITPESLHADDLDDLVQFAPVLLALDTSLTELPWADLPDGAGIRMRVLSTIMRLAFVDIGGRPTLWQRLHETGLINRPHREFDTYVDQLCGEANDWGATVFPGAAPVTAELAVAVMTEVTGGRSGRYYGPAVRVGHDFFCIDLLAACLRLEAVVAGATAGGGPVPNMRAAMWEKTVQRSIDRTKWQPTAALRAAISRPLKADGRVFSDLDAAGTHDGTLLVVSCKSWQMTERYDNLDHGARRNRAHDVIKAATKLASDIDKVAGLASRFVAPHDLVDVQGVVCVSMPILLTPDESAELERAAPAIPVLTLPELVERLAGAAPRHFDRQNWKRYLELSYRHGPGRQR